MSEFQIIDVGFKDEQVLLDSLREMGYNPAIHKNAQQLEGYQGDKREQKAHIIIPRRQVGRASNDVGFEKNKDGFKLHASQYDRAWRTGEKLSKLKQLYSEKKITKTVKKMSKYSIQSRVVEENKVKIRLRRVY